MLSGRTVFSSVCALALACVALAATRPHYGGTLRVAMQERITSLDPAQRDDAGQARWRVTPLIFETLWTPDGRPGLALGWGGPDTFRHFEFSLRRDVRFHDGTPLTPELAAKSLSGVIPGCTAR